MIWKTQGIEKISRFSFLIRIFLSFSIVFNLIVLKMRERKSLLYCVRKWRPTNLDHFLLKILCLKFLYRLQRSIERCAMRRTDRTSLNKWSWGGNQNFEQIKSAHRGFRFWFFNLKVNPHYQSGKKRWNTAVINKQFL